MLKYSKVVVPFTVTDTSYVSNTADAEVVPLWSNGTSYAIGQLARSDVTHRVYRSRTSHSGENPLLDDGTNWYNLRPTNQWAAFDGVVGTQTVGTTSMTFVVQTKGWTDTIALFNLEATSVVITARRGGVVVHTENLSLIDNSNIVDIYSYLTEPLNRKTEFAVSGITLPTDVEITVTISGGSGEKVKVGALVFGKARNIGILLTNWRLSLTDYSLKEFDEFGYYFLTRRASSDGGTFPMILPRGETRGVYNRFKDLRGIPCVWLIERDTVMFGFYRAFEPVFANKEYSEFDLVIEGLT